MAAARGGVAVTVVPPRAAGALGGRPARRAAARRRVSTSRTRTLPSAAGVRSNRQITLAVAVLALVLAASVGKEAVEQPRAAAPVVAASCTATPAAGPVGPFAGEQLVNAATIIATARSMAPPRAALVALATAMQESTLRNINYGDRDSLGLFQQRPSQGWGTPAQVTDPVYSTRKFVTWLLSIPGWEALPVTVAAQKVQRSAYPDAYAKWAGPAAAIVAATPVTCKPR